jgi:FtsP/CotA-like multicopper oxidase with cupredoxin domain
LLDAFCKGATMRPLAQRVQLCSPLTKELPAVSQRAISHRAEHRRRALERYLLNTGAMPFAFIAAGRGFRSFLVCSLALVACGVGTPGALPVAEVPPVVTPPALVQPDGWDDGVRLPEAVDLDPDPRVVEVNLEAKVAAVSLRAGTTTEAWTYDGGIPGPTIRVKVGDRLIVNFTNHLPEATTIHWHGLRIPVDMDGVPEHSAPKVEPGATFRYEFVVPDAGLFWYHPHFDSAAQVGYGLYGTVVVEDPAEPPGFGDPVILQLSDISLDENGQLNSPTASGAIGTLFGREGNVVLVNGRQRPTLLARAGLAQRWRIVNSAKARYFQLAMAGHRFIRIGGDGGLIGQPVESDRIVVIPGGRADVVVIPTGAPGDEVPLRWVAFDRGYGTAFNRPDEEIMRLRLVKDAPVEPRPLPATGRHIDPIDTAGATPIAIDFTRNDIDKKFALGINGVPAGMDTPLHGHVGETQVWTIGNKIDWDHPFHLHGFFFQVLNDDGSPAQPIEWRDTVNVPVKKTVKVVVKYDARPGMWMFHCHILDHADAGMMGMLHLSP